MKKLLIYGIAIAWAIFGTLGFAVLWLRMPALWIINLPESAWVFLMKMFGATCCESAADIEFVVALTLGFITTCALSLLVFGIYRAIKHPSRATPKNDE